MLVQFKLSINKITPNLLFLLRMITFGFVVIRWESDLGYCRFVKRAFPEGPRVLDFVDVAIFDYLTGNADRHHYETYSAWGKDSSVIMLDNGKRYVCKQLTL